jgi:tetratricopeptide (TPR) repeat protein
VGEGYREARRQALLAHATAPSQPEAILDVVQRLRPFGEALAVREHFERLRPLKRASIPVLLRFAQVLSAMNLQAQALACLDEARRGDPSFPPTLAARAQVLTYLGRIDEAAAELKNCLARAPELAQAQWQRARLREWSADENHVDAVRREIARPGRKPNELVLLQFALHKELDDLGEHAPAWEALAEACRLRRAAIDYDEGESVQLFRALAALPPGQRTPDAAAPAGVGPVPIFIVGMHRSGTTLLEQMLARHSRVRDMGELYDFTAQMRYATDHHCRGVVDLELVRKSGAVDLAEVGKRYLESIAWRAQGRDFAVDKLPSNFLNLGFILGALPRARVLHMVRDPMETCFSNLRELFSDANPHSYDQRELAGYYARYRELMAHWHARFPGRIHDLRYDALVGETETTLRGVADYCGFDFEPAMLRPGEGGGVAATASAAQVRGGVRQRRVAKWVPYAPQLAPLAQSLRQLGVPEVIGPGI